ncbi:hypothetical protein H0H92_000717 [Tricholoma furcatifolium]|nr:hypothetical protein H0H92_000717 [Tricholoma furcatifolium]
MLTSSSFSGIVAVQAFVYSKFYPSDAVSLKSLVSVVWLIDVLHTIFVSMSLWDHFIVYFGKAGRIDYIPWSLAWTIALTAILTFLVHCFYVHRIFKRKHFVRIRRCIVAQTNGLRSIFLSTSDDPPKGIIATLRLVYANSLLATLNTRKILNGGYNSQTSGDRVNIPIYDSNLRRISRSPLKHGSDPRPIPGHVSLTVDLGAPLRLTSALRQVQIKVEEMTLRTVDCGDLTYNGERSPTTDRESNKSQTNSLA